MISLFHNMDQIYMTTICKVSRSKIHVVKLLNSTTNISNASDPILTPQKIFISDEELNKTLSSIKKQTRHSPKLFPI